MGAECFADRGLGVGFTVGFISSFLLALMRFVHGFRSFVRIGRVFIGVKSDLRLSWSLAVEDWWIFLDGAMTEFQSVHDVESDGFLGLTMWAIPWFEAAQISMLSMQLHKFQCRFAQICSRSRS